MKPTIGRIVHYFLPENYGYPPEIVRKKPLKLRTYAAIISGINETSALIDKGKDVASEKALEVCLVVFGLTSGNRDVISQTVPYSDSPKAGHWSWPPKSK